MRALRFAILALLSAGVLGAILLPPRDRVLGSYATSLERRTPGQRANALRAAQAIDGVVIESGRDFSFNRTVGSWTPDHGYVRAPVSYDGDLMVDWGGGVCQTSSTLYNAALIAGLEIAERHRHTCAIQYVPPGRDAAVAQYTIDLRLRNPYPWRVRLRARLSDDRLGFEVLGRERGPMAEVEVERLAVLPPTEVRTVDDRLPSGARASTHGRPGVRVAVYRTLLRGPHAGSRELVSQDTYPPANRLVR